ncbi:MAG TPA: hypothetical protein VFY67_09415 [Pyrinomonadaceae bacterium]|nr:hypothetical protein [Pyrinomonadaceae bacterium]
MRRLLFALAPVPEPDVFIECKVGVAALCHPTNGVIEAVGKRQNTGAVR